MSIIRVEGATKEYYLGKTVVPALRGVDLQVEKGEFLAIAGPSGSGKTTLLNLIGCIEKPSAGKVSIDGVDTAHLTSDELADLRATKIGFIFQNFNLLPVLTALENVEYPLSIRKIPAREKRRKARQLLEAVGLSRFLHHKPLELSGGQRQRVAIARAMVADPAMILADEPTANLDHTTGQEILNLMKQMNAERKTTFLFSTHDPKVMAIAQRVVPLSDGIVADPQR
ncbi:MAG: ABC transporter ATP-binding protein [Candidatus Omnitrophica bacterium]|nr:ABC transporter ATP-binding protein [Candidatus Omnitrophota bacterium]